MKKATKSFAVGALVAGVAGYLAGILTAPQSGKETRQDIKEGVQTGMVQAEKTLKKLHSELNDVVAQAKAKVGGLSGSAKEQLTKLLNKATEAKEKVRVVLSAIHEGDADDKDLDQAVKQANAALTSLKDYLKK